MYYFDNAATTAQKPLAVAQAVYDALSGGLLGNPSRGAHAYSLRAYGLTLQAKELVKTLFHTGGEYDVAFTHHSTAALNMVLKGLFGPGDHVLTTTWEHNAVLRSLYQLEQQGTAVDFIGSEAGTGALQYGELEQKLRPSTKAVVCNHASNVTGNVVDLERVKDFCRKHSLMLVVDASQSAGAYPIDLSDGVVTALCFTGHKSLYGPGGTGGVCIRKDTKVRPYITGGDGVHSFAREQPKEIPGVFEAGTANVAGIAGLAAGVHVLLDEGLEAAVRHQEALGRIFTEGIRELTNITLYGDFSGPRVGVYALNVGDADSALVSDILWDQYGMATRSGFHCAPLMHEELHTERRGAVRFSFSRYTTEDDVAAALRALRDISAMET